MNKESGLTQESSNISEPLTKQQLQMIEDVRKFMELNTLENEEKLKTYQWTDIYEIIRCETVDNNTRIVCCSALKWLILHNKFINDANLMFKKFLEFYLIPYDNINNTANKAQEIVEIILKEIPAKYMNKEQQENTIDEILKELPKDITKSLKLLKIISIILEETEPESINNEVLVGEILLFLESILEININVIYKSNLFILSFNIIQNIIDIINNDNNTENNVVEEFLNSSTLAKKIIHKIIFEGSNQQIVTQNKTLNEVKLIALELYSSIWMYSVDENMFKLCINSVITGNHILYDEQLAIIEKTVQLIERSISQESYYNLLYVNVQSISMALLRYLSITPQFQTLIESDPEAYVDLQEDLCMTQQTDYLVTKVCSLLSSLCLYIDGYMTFVGMVCVMVIKAWGSGLKGVDKGEQYMESLNSQWNVDLEEKAGICSLVICCLSDQFEKRSDLSRPLSAELSNIVNLFNIQTCKLPSYLICRFMLLYTYMSHPKYLSTFFPYSKKSPLYSCQLQSCYKILLHYSSRHPEYKAYITQLSSIILETNKLTPLLENEILNGNLSNESTVWMILERLCSWFEGAIKKYDRVGGSKIANLIRVVVERMEIEDHLVGEGVVWGYLSPLWKKEGLEAIEAEQFLMEIAVAFIKKFPSIQTNKEKLIFFLNIGEQTIIRNNTLNNCLDLFFELTKYLPIDLLYPLIQTYLKCLELQENREEDLYECYYGLEICMLRLKELGSHPPVIDIMSLLQKITTFHSPSLQTKVNMLSFAYILSTNPPISPIIPNINLEISIPMYETKPYCLYLLETFPYITNNITTSLKLLSLIIELMNREQKIANLIKNYEERIYSENNTLECEINAYSIYIRLPHPYLLEKYNIYEKFREFWDKFEYKNQIIENITEEEKNNIKELYNLWQNNTNKGNKKIRRIYKVKINQEDMAEE